MIEDNEHVNELRIQLQLLQEKLERLNEKKVVLKRLMRLLLLDPWRKLVRHDYHFLHQYDKNYSKSNFKPYLLDYKNKKCKDKPIIFHLISNFKTGGASRVIVDIAEYLSTDFEHIVITRYNPIPQNYEGIQVIELCSIPTQNEVKHLFKLHAPVIVHTHWSTRWSEEDSLWQWYYSFYRYIEHKKYPIVQNVNVPVLPFFFKEVKCVNVFVSNYVKQQFGFLNQDNQVIYPGSDFSFFSSNQTKVSSKKMVGMVYRLDNHKLKKTSIEPFISAVKQDKEITVSIVGDGALKAYFIKRIEEEGVGTNFVFHSYVPYDRLPILYAELRLFVAPVYEESFGQVTPFAMNMGIGVVGYNTGAILEIIQDPTCVVETGDVEGLAKLIVNKVNDESFLTSKMTQNRQLASQFAMEYMVEAYRNIYNELIIA